MNWILSTLQASIAFFDAWMSQLYDVLMLDPISYQNGAIWATVSKIYDALMGPAVSILTIGFYVALIHDSGEFIKTRHFGSVVGRLFFYALQLRCFWAGSTYCF